MVRRVRQSWPCRAYPKPADTVREFETAMVKILVALREQLGNSRSGETDPAQLAVLFHAASHRGHCDQVVSRFVPSGGRAGKKPSFGADWNRH